MTTTPPQPGEPHGEPHPAPQGRPPQERWDVVQQPVQQQHTPSAWAAQQRYAPPQQFRVIADHELASQASPRIATKALVLAIVGLVTSGIPILGIATGLGFGIAGLQQGIVSRVQRLGGAGRAIAAIVVASVAILSALVSPWVSLFALFVLVGGS